jgi:hypothetical protein
MVAVGVPGWPAPSTSWDWWSLVGIVLVCFVAMRSLRFHLRVPLVAVAIFVGPIVALLVHRLGVIPGLAWFALVATAASWLRSITRSDGRPPTV